MNKLNYYNHDKSYDEGSKVTKTSCLAQESESSLAPVKYDFPMHRFHPTLANGA